MTIYDFFAKTPWEFKVIVFIKVFVPYIIIGLILLFLFYLIGRIFSKDKKNVFKKSFLYAMLITFLMATGYFGRVYNMFSGTPRKTVYERAEERTRERLINLCEKYSVNEIYDEEAFERYKKAYGLSPYSDNSKDFEKDINLTEPEQIRRVLSQVNETYVPEEEATYGYWEKSGFLYYVYITKQVDECKKLNCFITESKLYDLKSKKLISHFKDFNVYEGLSNIAKGFGGAGSVYSPDCRQLKVGAFKENNKNKWYKN